MKKLKIYICIFIGGTAFIISAIFLDGIAQTLLLSLGTGLIASSLTAGFIDYSNYIDFAKKRKYIRNVELQHLSFDMLLLARQITGKQESKDINLLTEKLSTIEITEENEAEIIVWINSWRREIERELNTIRDNQNYFSLSGCFTEEEISFLCRSINFYDKDTSESNVKFVIDNIASYLEMFRDTI